MTVNNTKGVRLLVVVAVLATVAAGCDAGADREEAEDAIADLEDQVEVLQEEVDRAYEEGYEAAQAQIEGEEREGGGDAPADRPSGEWDEDMEPDDADVIVEFLEFYEPDDAEEMIASASQFNEPPRDGHRYVLVLVEVTNQSEEPVNPWLDVMFYAEGPERVIYDEGSCGALPSPELHDIAGLGTGGSAEGHVCFEMREADAEAEGERWIWADSWNFDVYNQ